MAKKNIAVIGAGYWGKNLIRVFSELGVLHTVCDSNKESADSFAVKYSVESNTWQGVLSNPDITAVALAVPAISHAKFAREALMANKHVFVEKPIALEMQDAYSIRDLADNKDKVLMVGHLLQYHPAFMKLKSLVRAGDLGKIQYLYSNRLSLGKIRNEEDVLWSFAPHDISMILALLNNEVPVNVTANSACVHNADIADTVNVHLDFASGVKAHVFVSWFNPIKEQKLVVIGDKAMAVFDDTKPLEEKLVLFEHKLGWSNGLASYEKAEGKNIQLEPLEPLKNELSHFIDCINNYKTPNTDSNEAIRVLEVLQKASTDINKTKNTLVQAKESYTPDYYIHESSIVDDLVEIGSGTKIWHFSHILGKSKIGGKCVIGQNVMIGPEVTVGDNCKIQNNVSLYKGVKLGDGVFCGPSCVFTNVNTPRSEIERKDEFRLTIVNNGVTIGANATIVCGVRLGEYCFIGAGAVVTKDVLPHALVVGNPARQIGWVSHAGERLDSSLICKREGKHYKIVNNQLVEIIESNIKKVKESVELV